MARRLSGHTSPGEQALWPASPQILEHDGVLFRRGAEAERLGELGDDLLQESIEAGVVDPPARTSRVLPQQFQLLVTGAPQGTRHPGEGKHRSQPRARHARWYLGRASAAGRASVR